MVLTYFCPWILNLHIAIVLLHLRGHRIRIRSKSDGETQVIVDLSWPHGSSENSYVSIETFDKMDFKLKYPTINNVIHKLRVMGPDTLSFKMIPEFPGLIQMIIMSWVYIGLI